MSIRAARILIVVAAGLLGLAGCSTSPKFGDTAATQDGASGSITDSAANSETTGTIVTQPAEPGPSGEPVAPLSKPGLLGDDPNDDVQLGKN
jgi:hypothetical protein